MIPAMIVILPPVVYAAVPEGGVSPFAGPWSLGAAVVFAGVAVLAWGLGMRWVMGRDFSRAKASGAGLSDSDRG